MENNTPKTAPAGTYEIRTAEGAYAGWYRDYKMAKIVAAKIGGKAVKMPNIAPAAKVASGHVLALADGTTVPFTRANMRAALAKR